MKTLSTLILAVFMVFFSIQTAAQIPGAKADPKSTNRMAVQHSIAEQPGKHGSGSWIERNNLEGIEGEIYIGSNWPAGIIVLRDGSTIDSYFLRYNMLSDQMQFIAGRDTLAFASPTELHSITFDNHTFVFETFECEGNIHQGYFELLVPGRNKLLVKHMVSYHIPGSIPDDGNEKEKFLVTDCYFLGIAGKPAEKVMCSRRSVLSVLNSHSNEMEEYMKATGNKVRNVDDLKKLVAYYNSLDEKR